MFGSSLRLIQEAGGEKVLYYSLKSEEVGTTPPKHKPRNPNPLSQHPYSSLLLAVNVAPRQQSGTPKHTHTDNPVQFPCRPPSPNAPVPHCLCAVENRENRRTRLNPPQPITMRTHNIN
jgi:hypothetical protein